MQFYLDAAAAIRRLPGIRAVAFSDSVPPGGWQSGMRWTDVTVDGKPFQGAAVGETLTNRKVTLDYFAALNIPVVRGRGFTEEDVHAAQGVVIISRLLAVRIFPGEDPIGRRVNRQTVVGVAENVKNGGLVEPDAPEIYFLRGTSEKDWEGKKPVMVIGSVLSAKVVAPWVRSQIAAIDPTVPVQIEALGEVVSKLADKPRFETSLLGFFALCGLLMAVIGLYGVISFLATQRTQEIGVRMALGASRGNILRLIAGEGLRLILLGGVLGLGAALVVARLLKSMLFHVAPHDPFTFAFVALALGLVAFAATLIPARAAMKVEPVVALRYE
jgi:predicted permease